MQTFEPVVFGTYYHIYNCGINGINLFREDSNYEYFLRLYDKYIDPVAETFAWCLMPNHFHLLVHIREEDDIDLSKLPTPVRVMNPDRGRKLKSIHMYFSDLFNSYTQAFNKRFCRHGSLFERPFKRKSVNKEDYLRNLVLYIHGNPVHHGFCDHPSQYPWSSYLTCLSKRQTKLMRETVISWFDDIDNFRYMHNRDLPASEIDDWLQL